MVEKLHMGSADSAAGSAFGPPSSATRAALKARGWLFAAAAALREAIYPPLCPLCRTDVGAGGGACASCWAEIPFIAPPACGVCGAPVLADAVCDGCAHAPPAWSRGAAATVYDGAARRLVLALKHGDRLDVAPEAGRWMARAGASLVAEADLIAPTPLHWRRMLLRRYNQAAELAHAVAAAAGRPEIVAPDLMERTRATPSMDGKNRSERLANVADAFTVAPRWRDRIAGRNILLIDDVMTTGATLSACADCLCEAGAADVNALVFARVARGDWPT